MGLLFSLLFPYRSMFVVCATEWVNERTLDEMTIDRSYSSTRTKEKGGDNKRLDHLQKQRERKDRVFPIVPRELASDIYTMNIVKPCVYKLKNVWECYEPCTDVSSISQFFSLSLHSGFCPEFLFHFIEHVVSKLSAVKMIFCVKLSRIVHQN